jgi:hypothetical protein
VQDEEHGVGEPEQQLLGKGWLPLINDEGQHRDYISDITCSSYA